MIVLLPGWEDSEGASQYEVPVARITGKVFYEATRMEAPDWDGVTGGHVWYFTLIPAPQPALLKAEPDRAYMAEQIAEWEAMDEDEGTVVDAEGIAKRHGHPQLADWERELVRTFETGATRDQDTGKLDYEGFFSPLALRRFAEYMHKNRYMKDGSMRAGDNWQKGIPKDAYMKSMWRHFMDVWTLHRLQTSADDKAEALCGLLFNAMGYLHELEKASL
jgi:hypothetical protein